MKIWRPAEGCSSRLPLSISSASWSSVFSLTTLLVCSDKLVTTAYVWHNSNDTIKTQGRMIFFAKPPYLPLPPFIFCNHTWGTPLMRNHWRRKLRTFGHINFKIPSNLLILHRVVVLLCFLLMTEMSMWSVESLFSLFEVWMLGGVSHLWVFRRQACNDCLSVVISKCEKFSASLTTEEKSSLQLTNWHWWYIFEMWPAVPCFLCCKSQNEECISEEPSLQATGHRN